VLLPLLSLLLGGAPTPELAVITNGELGETLVLELQGTSAVSPSLENLFVDFQPLVPAVFIPELGDLHVVPKIFLGPPNVGAHGWAFELPANPSFLGVTLYLQAYGLVLNGAEANLRFSTPAVVPLTTTAPSNLSYESPTLFLKFGAPMVPNVPSYDAVLINEWSVTPPLPSGLALDPVTGVISGTPTALTAGTAHTVSVGNGFGEADATVVVAVDILGTPFLEQTGPGFIGQSLQYELTGTTSTEDVIEFLTTDTGIYEPGVLVPGLGIAFLLQSPDMQVYPGSGDHMWTVALPDDPGLVGTQVYAQASGFVYNGITGGIRISNVARTLLLDSP